MDARTARGDLLRFVTISVYEFGSSSARQPDIRPILRGVASLQRRANDAGCYEFVEAACTAGMGCSSWRDQFGHDAAMSGDRDALASLDSADITTQVVFQLTNAR